MKRLWLKGANSVSRYHAGTVKYAVTFDTENGDPSACNVRDEVLLDTENGTVRHIAFCLLRSGQVEWKTERLEQQVGCYFKVVPITHGISFEDAKLSSDGALAACQIAAELRKPTYQPQTDKKHAGGKNTKSASKSTKSTKSGTKSASKSTSLKQATLLNIHAMLAKKMEDVSSG